MAYERGTPAGYIELEGQDEGVVEIVYFGLLPAFPGPPHRRTPADLGDLPRLDMAERWPDRVPTKRVWLHTCSKDGPYALGNYRRRGFRVFDVKTADEE
ncbi:N-acetyltransferase OS=Streptomyces antimycoticus OX=68175 GN=SANT12839_071040 PE=4 SV=1 [Streptomyces antimycoticus]